MFASPAWLLVVVIGGAAADSAWGQSADDSARWTPLCKSIRDFGVLPGGDPIANRDQLQEAIDWAAPRGAALFVPPDSEPYPVAGGLILRRNVSIVGVHGPVGRGTRHPDKPQPVDRCLRSKMKGIRSSPSKVRRS